MSNDLRTKALRGGSWSSVGVLGQAFFQLLAVGILSRLLEPSDFGLVAIAAIFLVFSNLITQVGLGPALIQRLHVTETHIRVAFTSTVSLSVIVAAVLWGIAPIIAVFFENDAVTGIVRLSLFTLPIGALGSVSLALLQKQLRFKALSGINIGTYGFCYFPVAVGLAYAGWGAYSIIIAQIVERAVQSAVLMYLARHPLKPLFEGTAFMELFYFSGGLTLTRFFNTIASQIDYFIVGKVLGVDVLGLYERIFKLLILPNRLFGNVVDKVAFPLLATIQEDKSRLAKAYLDSILLANLIMFPMSALMILMARDIVLIVLGAGWSEVVVPFSILVFCVGFRGSVRMIDSLVRATGLVYWSACIKFVYAVMVGLGAYFGSSYGLAGVAVGVNIAVLLNYFLMAGLANRSVSVTFFEFFKAHIPGAIVAIVLLVIVGGGRWVAVNAFNIPVIGRLSLVGLLCLLSLLYIWFSFPKMVIRIEGILPRNLSGRMALIRQKVTRRT